MIELIEGCAAGVAIATTIGLLRRRPKPATEPTCSSYVVNETHYNGTKRSLETQAIRHDCAALRSPTCMDGRCTFHCNDNCKCNPPHAAERQSPARTEGKEQ